MFRSWLHHISNYSKNNAYHAAVSDNDEETLHYLLGNQLTGINCKNSKGETPLLIAIKNHNPSMVKLLLDAEATHDNKYYTDHFGPLHLAARNGYYDAVKILIDADADVNAADKFGNTPLHSLVSEMKRERADRRSRIAELLLECGSERNAQNKCGKSPLHLAIANRHVYVVLTLLDSGADVGLADKNLYTPLHLSVKAGSVSLTKRLIKEGADVNVSNDKGMTPFVYALEYEYVELCRLLVRHIRKNELDLAFLAGSELRDKSNETALFLTDLRIFNTHGEKWIVGKLLERVRILNTFNRNIYYSSVRTVDYDTEFHPKRFAALLSQFRFSAYSGSLNMSQILIVIATISPFMATNSLRDLLGSILKLSSDIRSNTYTMIYQAMEKNNDGRLFKLLADHEEFDYRAIGGSRSTILHFLADRAKSQCSASCLKYLLKRGYDVNVRAQSNDYTPLHVAIAAHNVQCVRVLLQYSANVNLRDKQRNLPLKVALKMCKEVGGVFSEIIQRILRHIAVLESLGRKVDPENYKIINSDVEAQDYYHNCGSELTYMKECQVYDSVTLFDVMADPEHCNDRVIAGIRDRNDLDYCLIYHDVLVASVNRIKKRIRLHSGAERSLQRLFNCPFRLYKIAFDNILRHLTNRDLRNLALI